MSWLGWAICGWFALNALLAVARIGKQTKPLEPGTAVVAILIHAGLIAIVVAFWPDGAS